MIIFCLMVDRCIFFMINIDFVFYGDYFFAIDFFERYLPGNKMEKL